MANLFNKAKKTQTKKTTKTTDKEVVIPKFDSVEESKVFHEDLVKFAELKEQEAKLKAQLASLDSTIKELGMSQFVKNVEVTGKRESSYILGSGEGASVMVTVQDKYKTIDEERAEYLTETYGEEIVDENTTFAFNTAVLNRNMDAISKLIETSDEISDEDKENLITATTKYSVKKGTIDSVYKLSKDLDIDLETLIEEISPVIALKNAKA
jgi:hypothetical protein